MIGKYFLQFGRLPFQFVDGVLGFLICKIRYSTTFLGFLPVKKNRTHFDWFYYLFINSLSFIYKLQESRFVIVMFPGSKLYIGKVTRRYSSHHGSLPALRMEINVNWNFKHMLTNYCKPQIQ